MLLSNPQVLFQETHLAQQNMPVEWYIHLQACWDGVINQAGFAERQKAADEFNKANRWRKRGLAVIPTKFGISFTTKFLNQGAALVHIYTDGTVLVTHGGVEMGQGLHTKVAQVCSMLTRTHPHPVCACGSWRDASGLDTEGVETGFMLLSNETSLA